MKTSWCGPTGATSAKGSKAEEKPSSSSLYCCDSFFGGMRVAVSEAAPLQAAVYVVYTEVYDKGTHIVVVRLWRPEEGLGGVVAGVLPLHVDVDARDGRGDAW